LAAKSGSSPLQNFFLALLVREFTVVHWRYDDLSAIDYWNMQHWSTHGAPPAFDLANRPKKNYIAYVADASNWGRASFWELNNLRILVTPYSVLRYYLHAILQQLLNHSRIDLFERERS
jgi:hypothetical protein